MPAALPPLRPELLFHAARAMTQNRSSPTPPSSMPFPWFRRPDRPPVPLTLYTRAKCPLCDELKQELARARVRDRYELTEVDIDADPELTERYGRSIPVLAIGGRVAFKGRMRAREFERKFVRLAEAWREAAGEQR